MLNTCSLNTNRTNIFTNNTNNFTDDIISIVSIYEIINAIRASFRKKSFTDVSVMLLFLT